MKKTVIKVIKIFVITTLIIAALIAGSLAALRYFFSEDKIKEILISETSAFLKRKIVIDDLRYGFGRVVISGFVLYDGASENDPVIFKSKELNLGFSLFDLIRKKLNIQKISIDSPEFEFVFDENNETNIEKLIRELPESGSEKESISADVSQLSLLNAKISVVDPKGYFAPLGGDYVISADIDLPKKNIVVINNCTLKLPENRGLLKPDISITKTDVSVLIEGGTELNQASLLWVYKWIPLGHAPLPYAVVSGKVDKLKIEITDDKNVIVEGRASAVSTLSNSSLNITANGYCRVNVKQRTINLWDVNGKIDSSSLLLQNLLFTFDGRLLSFDSRNVSANIAHIRPILSQIPAKLFGYVRGNLVCVNDKFSGNLSISDAGYDVDVIRGITTEITINENSIKKAGIPVILLGNNCVLSVATTDDSLKRIFVEIKGQNFVIKDMSAEGDGGNSPSRPVSGTAAFPFSINGRIDLASVKYDKFNFGETSVNYSLSDGMLTIPSLVTNFMQGNISCKGSISLRGQQPVISATTRFDRIVLQDLAAIYPDFQKRLYGLLSGSGDINFIAGSDILSSLKGNVKFQINSGKIVNTGIQNGLGIWLSELKYKLTDLEFNNINGEISILGQNYFVDKFIFDSENIRLRLHGKINNKFEASDMNISLEFTPRFIQDIPTVGIALQNRKEGNWFVIPFLGNGKIAEGKNIKMLK